MCMFFRDFKIKKKRSCYFGAVYWHVLLWQKRRSSKQDKNCRHIRQHGRSAWRYHSPSLCQKPRRSPPQHTVHGQLHQSNLQILLLPAPSTSSIRKYLSTDAWSPHSFCHASVQGLRRIQNCAARLIPKQRRKTYHVTPLFHFLHWLPIQQRIQYKINTLCYKCITGTAPSYLCDCLQLYTPSRPLRSASDTLSLQIPRTRLSTVGSRAFSVFGPSTGNDLPLPLRQKTLSGLIEI